MTSKSITSSIEDEYQDREESACMNSCKKRPKSACNATKKTITDFFSPLQKSSHHATNEQESFHSKKAKLDESIISASVEEDEEVLTHLTQEEDEQNEIRPPQATSSIDSLYNFSRKETTPVRRAIATSTNTTKLIGSSSTPSPLPTPKKSKSGSNGLTPTGNGHVSAPHNSSISCQKQISMQSSSSIDKMPSSPFTEGKINKSPESHTRCRSSKEASTSPLLETVQQALLTLSHTTSFVESNDPGEDRYANRPPPPPFVKTENATSNNYAVYCVFDGHGGPRASEYAAEVLIPEVLQRLDEMNKMIKVTDEDILSQLKKAFITVDNNFLDLLDQNMTQRLKLYSAHVGDCRAVLGQNTSFPKIVEASEVDKNRTQTPKSNRLLSGTTMTIPESEMVVLDTRNLDQQESTVETGTPLSKTGAVSPPRTRSNLGLRRSPRKACTSALPILAYPLTVDHNCANAREVDLVRKRCGKEDKRPIRTRIDQGRGYLDSNSQVTRLNRVAGSLAVTRALGDAYLKRRALSFDPFRAGIPYITGEPEVSVLQLDPARDRFLVLATDGLWERLSNEEAVQCVGRYYHVQRNSIGVEVEQQFSQSDSSPKGKVKKDSSLRKSPIKTEETASSVLLEEVLGRVATQTFISLSTLKGMQQGRKRRRFHDDICITVVKFNWGISS